MTPKQVFKTNKRIIIHFEKALDASTSFYLHTDCAAKYLYKFSITKHKK